MPQTAQQAQQQVETRSLPLQTRLAPVASINAEARTFECVWTSGAPVRRFDWVSWSYYMEELSLDPAHMRMGRMEAGAPLLNTHQQWDLSSVLGVVDRAWLAGSEGRALSRFSQRDEEVQSYWRDVVDGIIRNISVGYIVHRYQKTDAAEQGGLPTWLAIDWEPAELSLVPVGADPFAGVRSLGATMPAPEQRQQLLEEAMRSVGRRSFACELVPTGSRGIVVPVTAALGRAEQPPAASAANQPHQPQQELTMDEDVQARGASTAAGTGNPAGANTPPVAAAAAAAGTRSEAEIRTAERERITAIRNVVGTARRSVHGVSGLDQAFEDSLINSGQTVDQARAAVFAKLEAASSSSGPQRSAAALETVRDEQVQRRSDMAAAVSHRANPNDNKLPESARRYRGYTLSELARRSLEDQGVDTSGMSRAGIVAMAMGNSDDMGFRALHGTSDFTIALASTVNRSLRQGYEGTQRTFTRWARKGTLADFRAAQRVAVAGNLGLVKVNEFGEFKRGKLVDSGESIQLGTYGKVVGVTRQAVINDDLDFLSRLPQMFGRVAAEFESDTVYGILTTNAAMSDGTALFHANHGNLAASGAVIGEASLTAARKALRLQKDPSGNNQPLNLVGRYIIVPAAKETEAQKQFTAVVVASSAANTNVFQNSYEIVTEPRLDANSATSWYLVADNAQIDTIEYAYLEGEEGLYTEQRTGFDVDGLEVKARLDFAAKAIDWRGLYKDPGA